jgi:hypothetical protein
MGKVKLRDVVIARKPIYLDGDNYFEVRGIALADILKLSKMHMERLVMLFNDFMARKGDGPVTNDLMTEFLVDCIGDAQDIVTAVIALAADDDTPEAAENFMHLRTPVQIEALLQVAALSITTEAELKKLVEAVTKIIRQVTGLVMTTLKNAPGHPAPEEEDFRFPNGVSAPVRESVF